MYINKQGVREIGHVLFKEPTLGRLMTTAWVAPLYVSVRQTAWMFRALDDVLYPAYRDQQVERPVFVFANPRSGTTLAHRLMSLDNDVFTTVKLYQTMLPSVTATRFFKTLAALSETRLGTVIRSAYGTLNEPLENRWQGVHHISLDQAEEDVATLLWNLASPTAALLFPFVDDLPSQTWIDMQPREDRDALLSCYESTIKRHVYEAGGKRFLNKNVFFSTRVRSFYEKFPDAVFVYLIRNPYDCLPSFLNMFYRAWVSHSPSIRPDGKEIEALKRLGYDYYHYALACRKDIPEEQFLTVRYEDLTADPKRTMLDLYGRLGMPVSRAFESKLGEASLAQRGYESPRSVELDFFGISPREVASELSEVFETFGYDTAERPDLFEAAE